MSPLTFNLVQVANVDILDPRACSGEGNMTEGEARELHPK
jgi:hypothetical protein